MGHATGSSSQMAKRPRGQVVKWSIGSNVRVKVADSRVWGEGRKSNLVANALSNKTRYGNDAGPTLLPSNICSLFYLFTEPGAI